MRRLLTIALALFVCGAEIQAQRPPAEKKVQEGSRASRAPQDPSYSLTPGTPSKEYIYLGDKLVAIDEGDLAGPAAPTNLTAVACFSPEIYLTWTDNSSNEAGFTLERKPAGGAWTPISLAANTTAYFDRNLSASTTYFYRVKATSGGDSGYSNEASTATAAPPAFTDSSIVAGVTPVKAVHVSELRQAVNTVRACARLAAASWTYPALSGDPVYAVDVQELRSNLGPALSTLGEQAPAYTDNPVVAGTEIKKVHVDELRLAVQ